MILFLLYCETPGCSVIFQVIEVRFILVNIIFFGHPVFLIIDTSFLLFLCGFWSTFPFEKFCQQLYQKLFRLHSFTCPGWLWLATKLLEMSVLQLHFLHLQVRENIWLVYFRQYILHGSLLDQILAVTPFRSTSKVNGIYRVSQKNVH